MATTPSLALVRFLNSGQAAIDLAATGVLGADVSGNPWVSEDNLIGTVENSSKCAIVVSLAGTGQPPNDYNTEEFPRIQVDVWADPDRDPTSSFVTNPNAKDKILDVFKVINKYCHLVTNGFVFWDDIRVLGSTRVSEPIFSSIADGGGKLNGGYMATNYYNLEIG